MSRGRCAPQGSGKGSWRAGGVTAGSVEEAPPPGAKQALECGLATPTLEEPLREKVPEARGEAPESKVTQGGGAQAGPEPRSPDSQAALLSTSPTVLGLQMRKLRLSAAKAGSSDSSNTQR